MNVRHWLLSPCLLLTALPAPAAGLFQPIELSDAELAQLRGRYVLPDRIISFGVTMSSSWQNSAGQTIGAQVALNVMSGQSQPSLTITPLYGGAGNPDSLAVGTGQVIGGAGLDSVQGIVQSVRTAGDYNVGNNNLSVDITRDGSAAAAPLAGQPLQASQTFSNQAGSISVSAINGGLQMSLLADRGQGSSGQQLGNGGLSQHSSIAGVQNNVQNLAALSVAMRDNMPGVDLANCAWDQLRALRPTGY